jgi:hypothetical protein
MDTKDDIVDSNPWQYVRKRRFISKNQREQRAKDRDAYNQNQKKVITPTTLLHGSIGCNMLDQFRRYVAAQDEDLSKKIAEYQATFIESNRKAIQDEGKTAVVPFGKYRGKTFWELVMSESEEEQSYARWMSLQPWLREDTCGMFRDIFEFFEQPRAIKA